MKRPICYLSVAYVVAVLIYVLLFPPSAVENRQEGVRKQYYGYVYHKEIKDDSVVIYVKNVQEVCSKTPDSINQINQNPKKEKNMLCYLSHREVPRIGSYIHIEGKVTAFKEARNQGEYNQKQYYEIQKIGFSLRDAVVLRESKTYSAYHELLFQVRISLETRLEQYMQPKDASIMKAILLGNKQELEQESKKLFQDSGISHILAISGLHITILGMGLYQILKKIHTPTVLAAFASISMMIMYGDMIGMSSSALRAILMFGVRLGAVVLKRTYDIKTSIAITAIAMLIEQPYYVLHTGFLLSYGAVLGIACMLPIFSTETANKKKQYGILQKNRRKIEQKIQASCCIWLVQLPVLLSNFYTISVYSVFVNLAILPFVGILIMIGILICFSYRIPVLGSFVGVTGAGCCHVIFDFFEIVCKTSLSLPNANAVIGKPDHWRIVLYYGVLLALWLMENGGRKKKQLPISIQLKRMILLVAISCLLQKTRSDLKIVFLDVGQGDCIYMETQTNHHYLIDCGSTTKNKVGTYTLIPYLKYQGISRLDQVFVTHMDADHMSGIMELIENEEGIQIGQVILPGAIMQDETYVQLRNACKEQEIEVMFVSAKDKQQDGKLILEVLHPASTYQPRDTNAYSFILKLEYGAFHALFTGDANADGELLAAEQLNQWHCDLFKVTHHGSKYANTMELLETIQPKRAVISCGEKNQYGHPHKETLDRLKRTGCEVIATKDAGEIDFVLKRGKLYTYTYVDYNRTV